jgi:hypothetical protein
VLAEQSIALGALHPAGGSLLVSAPGATRRHPDLASASVAATGLCDAATQLPQLVASPACQTPTTDPTGSLPLAQPLFLFDQQPDAAWEAGAVRQLREARIRAAKGIVPAHPEYDSVQPL